MLEHTIEQHLAELGFLPPAKDEEKKQQYNYETLPAYDEHGEYLF
jgi:hypothetical protein